MADLTHEQTRMLRQFMSSVRSILSRVESVDRSFCALRDSAIDDAATWTRILIEKQSGIATSPDDRPPTSTIDNAGCICKPVGAGDSNTYAINPDCPAHGTHGTAPVRAYTVTRYPRDVAPLTPLDLSPGDIIQRRGTDVWFNVEYVFPEKIVVKQTVDIMAHELHAWERVNDYAKVVGTKRTPQG